MTLLYCCSIFELLYSTKLPLVAIRIGRNPSGFIGLFLFLAFFPVAVMPHLMPTYCHNCPLTPHTLLQLPLCCPFIVFIAHLLPPQIAMTPSLMCSLRACSYQVCCGNKKNALPFADPCECH